MKKIILLLVGLISFAAYSQDLNVVGAQKGGIQDIKIAKSSTQSKAAKQLENIDNSVFDCIYEYRIKTKSGVEDITKTILQIGENTSKFWDYSSFCADSVAFVSDDSTEDEKKEFKNREQAQVAFFDPVIYQNFPKGKITVDEVIAPNYFRYEEKKGELEWKLEADTTTVCGYYCRKAITTYGGREWSVWYTPEIAVGYGPWKFSDLPGLILKAEDSEGIHRFTAIAVRQKELPIFTEKNVQRMQGSREKIIKAKNDFEESPMDNIPVEAIGSISVSKFEGQSMISVNGVQVRMRPNGYVPLEIK